MNPLTNSDTELFIQRTFDAPRELVFRMWTEAEHLSRWCCPIGFTIPHSEGDIRAGGRFRMCMRSPTGEDHWLGGTYREIVPPERLVFTHAWQEADGSSNHQTVVTVTFEARQGKTQLSLHQAFFQDAASRAGHEGGWQETLDNLTGYLARQVA